MSDRDTATAIPSNTNTQLGQYNCCSESNYLCCLLPLCVIEIRFIYRELRRPARDQDLKLNDVVLIDKDLNYASSTLYGLIVNVTSKTVQVFSNGETLEKRLKKNVQKVRSNKISESWQQTLLIAYSTSIYSIE